jgi:hypothetical protein
MPRGRWRRAPAADFTRNSTIDQQGEALNRAKLLPTVTVTVQR